MCWIDSQLRHGTRGSRVPRIEKRRNKPKSRFTAPGPRSRLRPEVPKRTPVGAAKALGSKNGCPTPIPPRFSTTGFTWSAVCVLPGAFSAPAAAVTTEWPSLKGGKYTIYLPVAQEPACRTGGSVLFVPAGRKLVDEAHLEDMGNVIASLCAIAVEDRFVVPGDRAGPPVFIGPVDRLGVGVSTFQQQSVGRPLDLTPPEAHGSSRSKSRSRPRCPRCVRSARSAAFRPCRRRGPPR